MKAVNSIKYRQNEVQLICIRKQNASYYYMVLSYEDWELPNSQITLAENNIDHGLDFAI